MRSPAWPPQQHCPAIRDFTQHHRPCHRRHALPVIRPSDTEAQTLRMTNRPKQVCSQCHTPGLIDHVYSQAEQLVQSTNQRVQSAQDIVNGLRKDGALTGPPFSQPIDFVYFDLWHYDGRISKHGAFMGGADFVQWHGTYPMLQKTVQLNAMAAELRKEHTHAR